MATIDREINSAAYANPAPRTHMKANRMDPVLALNQKRGRSHACTAGSRNNARHDQEQNAEHRERAAVYIGNSWLIN